MRGILAGVLILGLANSGCMRPSMPGLPGRGLLYDLSAVKQGMSANEVRRVMGEPKQTIFDEGIQGIDGGNYIWEYPNGRVYFNLDGVTRVERTE